MISQIDLDNNQLDEIIQQILTLKDNDNRIMLSKFDLEFIVEYISLNLTRLELIFNSLKHKKGIHLLEFLLQMLKSMQYGQTETLYVAIGLIDFYKAVLESENLTQFLYFQNITNFITERNSSYQTGYAQTKKNYYSLLIGINSNRKIATKKLPVEKKFNVDLDHRVVREIDINPPILLQEDDSLIKRLTNERNCIDSVRHNKNIIVCSTYSPDIQRLISLDGYSDKFLFYDNDCNLTHSIKSAFPALRGQMCIDFFYSHKQQRLGACFRDGFMVFWDQVDNFNFEKVLQTGSSLQEEQQKIWYVELCDQWVTTDKKNQLYFWDLEKESVSRTLKSERFEKGIIQLKEIPFMKMVAIATGDNDIVVWDFVNMKQLMRIEPVHRRLNQMTFFKSYQLLLTAGYDDIINVCSFHSESNDYNQVGKLIGHMSLVTAVQCVENTPMVITADDRYEIKVWDIRDLKCIQTLNVNLRHPIKFIHILPDRVFLVGSRVMCVFFEDSTKLLPISKVVSKKILPNQNDSGFPIVIEYDSRMKEFCVCSRQDVRFIDAYTGRVKRIVQGIITQQGEEITSFRIFQQSKKFLVSNQKGQISTFQSSNGELIFKEQPHSDEISVLKIDYLNKLLISASFDGNLFISRELQNGTFEKLREIQIDNEIQMIGLSVYHNIIAISFSNNEIYLVSYEYGKMLAVIYLQQDEEPTSFEFINGYPVMVIGTSNSFVYFVHFKTYDDSISLQLIAKISLNEQEQQEKQEKSEIADEIENSSELKEENYDNTKKIEESSKDFQNDDSKNEEGQREKPEEANIFNSKQQKQQQQQQQESAIPSKLLIDLNSKCILVAIQSGEVRKYDVSVLFSMREMKQVPHANKKVNYNAYRSSKEDVSRVLNKTIKFRMHPKVIIKDQTQETNPYAFKNSDKSFFLSAIQAETHQSSSSGNQKWLNSSLLKVIGVRDPLLEEQLKSFCILTVPEKVVQMHKEQLQCFQFVDMGEKYLLTSSRGQIKIWSFPSLDQCCNLNIDHPLPIQWNISIDSTKQNKTKILFALKTLQCITNKQDSLDLSQSNLNLRNLFSQLKKEKEGKSSNKNHEPIVQNLENSQYDDTPQVSSQYISTHISNELNSVKSQEQIQNDKTKVRVMKEEFTARDILFDKIKGMYSEELRGPSLKHLNEMKKLFEAQELQKKQQNNLFNQEDIILKQKLEKVEEKGKEYKHLLTFFNPQFRDKILSKGINYEFQDKMQYIEDLEERFERAIQKKKRAAIISIKDDQLKEMETITGQKPSKKKLEKKFLSMQRKFRTNGSPSHHIDQISQSLNQISNNNNTKCGQYSNNNNKNINNSNSSFNNIKSEGLFNTALNNQQQAQNSTFYEYAFQKNLIEPRLKQSFSIKDPQTPSGKEVSWQRKDESKNFSSIIKKMNENLQKSKVNSSLTERSHLGTGSFVFVPKSSTSKDTLFSSSSQQFNQSREFLFQPVSPNKFSKSSFQPVKSQIPFFLPLQDKAQGLPQIRLQSIRKNTTSTSAFTEPSDHAHHSLSLSTNYDNQLYSPFMKKN